MRPIYRKEHTAMEKDLRDEVVSIVEQMEEPLLSMALIYLRYLQESAENPLPAGDDPAAECHKET